MSPSPYPTDTGSVYAVLLAGGKGTRFWPASRKAHPKQFLKLFGDRSLLRTTYERFARIVPPERILVVTGRSYAAATRMELPEIPAANFIVEPSGRDTAPAAALAARASLSREADPVLVVAPTDHFIGDEEAFARALGTGLRAARGGALVTFGIVPRGPATTYGYIQTAGPLEPGAEALSVVRFREKPGPEEAQRLLDAGGHYWNAGIFAWRARTFEERLASANPAFWAAFDALRPLLEKPHLGETELEGAWERLPSISIDYALMERASGVALVPLDAGWSDVGSWDAVRELLAADDKGNRAAADVLYLDARDCSVHREHAGPRGDEHGAPAPAPRLYALLGVEGLIVVETPDAVLICRREAGESMRQVVDRLQASGRTDLT